MPVSVTRQGNNLPNGLFLPTIWSKKLNSKFYAQCFIPEITNSDYEGEIKGQGSQVNIRQRPTVQVFDYQENQDIQYQDVADEMVTLFINKAKGFAVRVGDIDKAQSNIPILNELTTDASYQTKIAIEKDFFSVVYAQAGNALAQTNIDNTTALNWIIDAEVQLEQNNIPADQRWVVIPPKVGGWLQKGDLKNASITGDPESIARKNLNNGRLGMIGGMTVYVSNNLTTAGGVTQCLAGHKSAVTFANQIVNVENLRLQTKFGDAVRGLNVYGYQTLIPTGLVSMPCTIS